MYIQHTVDGRNPAPVDRLFIPLFLVFQPFKVVQEFSHPPYFSGTIIIWGVPSLRGIHHMCSMLARALNSINSTFFLSRTYGGSENIDRVSN